MATKVCPDDPLVSGSFWTVLSKFETRGVRKVTTGIPYHPVYLLFNKSIRDQFVFVKTTTQWSFLLGKKELACGSQAFIATLLFDPSMSALPIIVKQNS